MTKSQNKVRDSAEAKRWLIVGAYKAGASEKHVARISGLSTTAVRNIILNYKRTGTPCIPKKIPNKGLLFAS
jgi:transposase